jgi:hypothetical protein
MTTTFFTACTQSYWPFVAPYAASVLLHNDDAVVEICVESPKRFSREHRAAIAAIDEHFPDRMHIRRGIFRGVVPGAVRWLETPERMSEYTYIGDVDILVLEGDITGAHVAHMTRTGLPYSNIVRPGTKRLSGLHFTRSDSYYPVQVPEQLHGSDEEQLYQIVAARGDGMPAADDRWRPGHGIHLSLNRAPTDQAQPHWGLHDRYVAPYSALWASPAWIAIAAHFHPAYQMALLILEAAWQAKRPDVELYRLRAARELWHSLAIAVTPARLEERDPGQ